MRRGRERFVRRGSVCSFKNSPNTMREFMYKQTSTLFCMHALEILNNYSSTNKTQEYLNEIFVLTDKARRLFPLSFLSLLIVSWYQYTMN